MAHETSFQAIASIGNEMYISETTNGFFVLMLEIYVRGDGTTNNWMIPKG